MAMGAMHGTHVGTLVQLTCVIHQRLPYKNMSNSVHNSHSALINFHIIYQGDTLIAHVLMALIVMYKYKHSGNKGDLRSKKGS